MICENPAPMGFSKPYKILILRSCGLQLMHDVRHQYRKSAKTKDNQRQPKTTTKQKKGSCLLCGTLNVQRLHQTLAWPEPFDTQKQTHPDCRRRKSHPCLLQSCIHQLKASVQSAYLTVDNLAIGNFIINP